MWNNVHESVRTYGMLQSLEDLDYNPIGEQGNLGFSVSLGDLARREYVMLGLVGESGVNAERVKYLTETPFEEMDEHTQNRIKEIDFINKNLIPLCGNAWSV